MSATHEVRGVGHSVRRKEDARFLRGRGQYFDDITLPGMLHMEILRSPYAHARLGSIDTSAAEALPGVVAVVTGELMAQHNLAWMPTLSVPLEDETAVKVLKLVEALEDLDDVQNVFGNFDIPDDVLEALDA